MPKLSTPLSAGITNPSIHNPLSISTVIMSLRGSTQPKLVLCSDNRLYVVKMHANPSSPNALANEFVGAALLRGLGFNTPQYRLVAIDQETLDDHPNLTLTGSGATVYRPSLGLNIASEYVEAFTPQNGRKVATLSLDFLGVGLFDIWAGQCDSRQYVHSYDPECRKFVKLFIDNASLFGGSGWKALDLYERPPKEAAALLDRSRYEEQIAAWIEHFQCRIPGLLQVAAASVQPSWHSGELRALECALLRRLADLPYLVSEAMRTNSRRQLLAFEAQDCSYHDVCRRFASLFPKRNPSLISVNFLMHLAFEPQRLHEKIIRQTGGLILTPVEFAAVAK